MPPAALVLGGGFHHEIEQACIEVIALVKDAGFTTEVIDDPAVLCDLDHDLLVVDALWWTMTADRYDDVRAEWARCLGEPQRAAIEAHVTRGRPILGVHTAVICFDDWPRWSEILGGRWNWDRSSHPPLGDAPVAVTVHPDRHPVVDGLSDFDIVDEIYGFLDLDPDVTALASSPHGGSDHPLLWARLLPTGSRVVVDLLGHDLRSMHHDDHRELLRRSIRWLVGQP